MAPYAFDDPDRIVNELGVECQHAASKINVIFQCYPDMPAHCHQLSDHWYLIRAAAETTQTASEGRIFRIACRAIGTAGAAIGRAETELEEGEALY